MGLKIGCGVAGCLGFGVVLMIVVGVVVFGGSKGSSASRPPGKSAPNTGSLRNQVRAQVGSWTLSATKPLTVNGSTDAIIATYRNGGLQLAIGLASFSSESRAETHLGSVTRKSRTDSKGAPESKIRIRGPKNDIIGYGTSFAGNPEVFVYRTGRVVGLIHGPPGQVKPFFSAF